MILDEKQARQLALEVALPPDAPPAYNDIAQPPASSSSTAEKRARPSPLAPSFQASSTSGHPTSSPSSPPHNPGPSSSLTSWFAFGASARTTREVKSTVLGILRDLVRNPANPLAPSLLDSCAAACTAQGLVLAKLLQEKYIEDHTPLYWAIINRPRTGIGSTAGTLDIESTPELLPQLLLRAAPLSRASISEVRLACLQNSDAALYQQLRQSRVFATLKGTDDMLLGASASTADGLRTPGAGELEGEMDAMRDEVEVREVRGDEHGAFSVRIGVPAFQRRMRVSGEVGVEFIARGRMWSLKFTVPSTAYPSQQILAGQWLVCLALMEHSAPTPLDARLTIPDASTPTPATKPKPPIELRLRCPSLTAPTPGPFTPASVSDRAYRESAPHALLASSPLIRSASSRYRVEVLLAKLDDVSNGSSLQYDGCAYVSSATGTGTGSGEGGVDEDGWLRCVLEGRLVVGKMGEDCVVC